MPGNSEYGNPKYLYHAENQESGDGYSDILIEIEDAGIGIVIEVKYARDGNLEAGCKEALRQIGQKQYEEILLEAGMEKILKYGIAFHFRNDFSG